MGPVAIVWIGAIAVAIVLVVAHVRRRRVTLTRASLTSILNRVSALLLVADAPASGW